MSLPRSILVTGTNRGIGLEIVRQLLSAAHPPEHVFATCRSPSSADELNSLAEANPSLHIIQLDTTSFDTFYRVRTDVAEVVGDAGLNVLFNNAGLFQWEDSLADVTAEQLSSIYQNNVVGPAMLTKTLLPLLQQAASQTIAGTTSKDAGTGLSVCRACIVNQSSALGSIASNETGGSYSCRMAKTALNMLTKNLSIELKKDGIMAVSVHPGFVKTDGADSVLAEGLALRDWQTPKESVASLINFMPMIGAQHNGGFFKCNGDPVQW